MRRIQIAIVVPIALLMAVAIAASANAGGSPHSAKSGVVIKSVSTSKSTHTWVFKGKVTSRNEKCLGKRRVDIYVVEGLSKRGPSPDVPVASGKTKDNGKFKADTGQKLLLLAPYRAVVAGRFHKQLNCQEGQSKDFQPQP